MSVAIAIGLVITALVLPQLMLVALRNWRVARRPCPHCRRKFGATAASISSDYYERRYGASPTSAVRAIFRQFRARFGP